MTTDQKLDALKLNAALAQIARDYLTAGNTEAADKVINVMTSMDTETAAKLAHIIRTA